MQNKLVIKHDYNADPDMGFSDGDTEYEKDQYYFYNDHLGSSSFVSDISGLPTHHIEYMPFGESFVNMKYSTWATPYTFNAKEQDCETGLHYYGARYYDARAGRFMSVDPLADEFPGYNPYHYVYNNPLRYTDPTGMGPDDIIIPEENRKEILYNLQKLTNDKLSVNPETGEVHISKVGGANTGKKLSYGSKLVKDLIRDDNVTTIVKTDSGNGTSPIGSNGKRLSKIIQGNEYDSQVGVDFSESNTMNEDGTRGGVPRHTTLGHELGHARTLGNGTNDRSSFSMMDSDTGRFTLFTAEEFNARVNENIIRVENGIKKMRAIPTPNLLLIKLR